MKQDNEQNQKYGSRGNTGAHGRGSDHSGQASEAGLFHAERTEDQHLRKGNSAEDEFDGEENDQDLDVALDAAGDDEATEEKLDALGGTERSDYGYDPEQKQPGSQTN